jgi:hypothetical protein
MAQRRDRKVNPEKKNRPPKRRSASFPDMPENLSGKTRSDSRIVRAVPIVPLQRMPDRSLGERIAPVAAGELLQGGRMVRKLILGLIAVVGLAANSGCILNQYSSNPNERMQQLLYQSEDLRQINNEWRRFWFNDQPSHLTPERIHGGVL